MVVFGRSAHLLVILEPRASRSHPGAGECNEGHLFVKYVKLTLVSSCPQKCIVSVIYGDFGGPPCAAVNFVALTIRGGVIFLDASSSAPL